MGTVDWVIQKNDDCIFDGSGDLGNYWDWKPGDAYLSAGAVTSNVTDMLAYAWMQNFGMSMLWFWLAYVCVTGIGILHTVFNIYVLHMKPMDSKGMGESYEKTKPWHPLYNINLFSVFGYLYMNGLTAPTMGEALLTGLLWAGICIVFDVFSWVLIKLRGA